MSVENDSGSPDARREKLARNQAIFREINERIRELDGRFSSPGRPLELVCECSDTRCAERVSVPVAEYEQVRAHPVRFLIHPGHEMPEIELVVAARVGYEIVEKLDDAGDVVAALDPRAGHADDQVSV